MRVNLYLNEKKSKDEIISNLLNEKYDPQSYIKEMLYAIAKGKNIIQIENNTEVKKEEEYEDIVGIENIEI
ncbi:hypothetical protein FDC58_17405 [Clostridium botulinum]|nr:hypothetical protein [Clostridium botulinum]NFP30969.1 hypothetical protein [Clostridium botulinum]